MDEDIFYMTILKKSLQNYLFWNQINKSKRDMMYMNNFFNLIKNLIQKSQI
jgi:hypothetical protein